MLKTTFTFLPIIAGISTTCFSVNGAQLSALDSCLLNAIKQADQTQTVAELKALCNQQNESNEPKVLEQVAKTTVTSNNLTKTRQGLISKRISSESKTENELFVLTPHLMNYILPALTTNDINTYAYQSFPEFQDNFEDVESKFQLSIKVPLTDDIFIPGDKFYFAFTLKAWWQIYSDNISKPFRETNYKPEVFYLAPLNWHPLEGNTGFTVGLEHESNGRSQALSRSWNRVYASFLFEKDNFALSFKPWWRLPEDEKRFVGDPKGDDNPDILDFMGHFELFAAYKWDEYELSVKARENFARHHGAIELGFTFPLWGKFIGYATAFNGYGESLIDYNHKQTRIGIGVALNNIL